jgi:acyl carrier protein
MNRDEIYERIVAILSDSFELEPGEIKPESTLYEELDLDSIDAIDIFVQLREVTGRRPDPADARKIRTVQELVEFVESEIAKGPEADDGSPPPDPRELFSGAAEKAAAGGDDDAR